MAKSKSTKKKSNEPITKKIEPEDNLVEEDPKEKLIKEKIEKRHQPGKKKIVLYVFLSISFLLALGVSILTFIHSKQEVHQLSQLVQGGFFLLFTLLFVLIGVYTDSKKGQNLVLITALLLIGFSSFQLLEQTGMIQLPVQAYVENFKNKSLTEVIAWGNANHITIETNYENSDLIQTNYVISQDVEAGTLVHDIESLTVVVSNGPDTSKEVLFPNMIGRNVDEVIAFVEENYFTNVSIDFEVSSTERDIVIEQDKSGQLPRDEKILIIASLGNEPLEPVPMEQLVGQSSFRALTWLKRNGIKYEIKYDYSDTISKGNVLLQSIEQGEMVDPNTDTVTITISKGAKIVAPNLLAMSMEEITAWVIENNLKIEFLDQYDDTIEIGRPIQASHKEGDILEEGDVVSVVLSKGPLKMEKFDSINDYRQWAEKYEIPLKEEVEFSDSVPSGSIIRKSHQDGDIIKNGDTVTVVVSQGKELKVPYLIGKSRSQAQSACDDAGVRCSFIYGGYTESTARDVVIKQSRNSGSTVSESATVTVTLSSGIIEKVDVPNFKGQTKASVQAQCDQLGITCRFVTEDNFSSTLAGTVTKQSASGKMNKGSSITVYLSRGEAKSYNIVIQPTWYGHTYEETVSTLKAKLESLCPGVTFVFKPKDVNEGSGLISSDSSVKAGPNTFVQGRTYTITVNR